MWDFLKNADAFGFRVTRWKFTEREAMRYAIDLERKTGWDAEGIIQAMRAKQAYVLGVPAVIKP